MGRPGERLPAQPAVRPLPRLPHGATANGTRLQIWDCNGSAAQIFRLT